MKNSTLKRIEALENGLSVGRKIPLLYYTYPVYLNENRDSKEAKEARAEVALQKKLDEVSRERGEKITEDDIELIVGIKNFFSNRKEKEDETAI